jgi:pimeloyl-ACP methyl ester carboxylesterase
MRHLLFIAASLAVIALFGFASIVAFSRITDFELPEITQQAVSFSDNGNRLEGTLITASADGPTVLLVHGDGAQDRWSDDGYLPLVNTLLDAGISVFSWDKPGVGASTGNWLHQSMTDRANETVAALAAVRQATGFEDRTIGLLGFSQAGWVLPRVPALTDDASFLVLMGGAINWQAQGRYYATIRLTHEGQTSTQIAAELLRQAQAQSKWLRSDATFADYRAASRPEDGFLSADRFRFAQLNYQEDAREDIAKLTLPVLVLSGAADLNVDSRETIAVYTQLLKAVHPLNAFHLVPNASHSLMSASYLNYQLPDQIPLLVKARFILAGRDAYEGDVLKTVTDWVFDVSQAAP